MALILSNLNKYTSGAKTKGYLKNNVTGEKKSFYFNPSELSYERGATYQEFSSPGLNYPLFNYVKGNSVSFPVPLKIFDKSSTGLIKDWEDYLSKFLPPTTNTGVFSKPDSLTFVMGSFICECFLENLGVQYEDFDENLLPIECTFNLTLRRI